MLSLSFYVDVVKTTFNHLQEAPFPQTSIFLETTSLALVSNASDGVKRKDQADSQYSQVKYQKLAWLFT